MRIETFTMPQPGNSLAEFEAAARRLTEVVLSRDHIVQGYQFYIGEGGHSLAQLARWTAQQGFASPDVAAHAIRVRATGLFDALSDLGDLEKEIPEVFEALMFGPLYPADLGYYPTEWDQAA